MKLFAADVERIARWAHGSRQGKPITAHTIGEWIKKDELKATKAANTEWKRQTRRTNESGQVEVTDTSPWEIDLDDLEHHPKVVIDQQQLADLESERKRGTPDETARRVSVTEKRMAAMETRITELEQERADLMHRINTLEADRTTMRLEIASIHVRLDEPKVPAVTPPREKAPETRHDTIVTVRPYEPPPVPTVPFVPAVAQPVRAPAPVYGSTVTGMMASWERPSLPARRDNHRLINNPPLPDGWESVNAFAETHHIGDSTWRRWRDIKLFDFHVGKWRPHTGAKPVEYALDREQQQQLLQIVAMQSFERELLIKAARARLGIADNASKVD